MNKSDLFDIVGKKFKHLPIREVEKIVQKIFSSISDSLSVGNRVEIRGFGSFSVRSREKRLGRNPKTGEKIEIKEKTSLNFKQSKNMKRMINEK
tara:strand:- start:25 stop:306 length:282 start_codon:yes stop_codon:yes gene_type:complete